MEMMGLMQGKITQCGFSQPTTTIRSWINKPDQEKWEIVNMQTNESRENNTNQANFLMQIQYRYNSSW
ncbi:MAG TPA: hypothetical protein DD791_05595 [Syntrophomonas sp.]|nr:hypothetical protein [Syntrophomonas sp.]